MRKRLLSLALLAGLVATPAGATPHLADAEVVFRWADQRCADDWIPDSPARAVRRTDGSILLMATHYTNGVMTGPDFESLRPDCSVVSRGAENPDPAAFDDRYWIQALLPTGGGRLLAIGSHEFLGARHAGRCRITDRRRPHCWYSALTLVEADESALVFRPRVASHVLAAPSSHFDPSATRRTGIFTATNIVRDGDWYYFLAWVELGELQGACLFRAHHADPTQWRALREGRFEGTFPSAYADGVADRRCDIVGRGTLLNIPRSVVRIDSLGRWAAVFIVPDGRAHPEGIYVSYSTDLRQWSAPRLVARTEEAADGRNCRAVYQYPSLIDHDSRSDLFDTGSSEPYLYLTRFNKVSCRGGLDRDLVRIRLRLPS